MSIGIDEEEEVLGLRWGGPHTCGHIVEMLWVSPVLAQMQGLSPCLHIDLIGATLTFGHVICDGCGLEVLPPTSQGRIHA